MSMEYDRRSKENTRIERSPSVNSENSGKANEKLTPPTQEKDMRKRIAEGVVNRTEKSDAVKDSKEPISKATEQQRNRDLWKK